MSADTATFTFRIPPELRDELDRWQKSQLIWPSRSQVVLYLIRRGIEAERESGVKQPA